MNITVLNNDENEMIFTLEKTTPAFANTIRRLYIDEVPTLAIEDVEFRQNSSIHYDETVAHRLGLMPIKTDLKSYNLPDKCKCEGEGCAQCQLKMKLNVTGPAEVIAKDVKSTDPKATLIHDKTPIVKLLKDQAIELEATAVLGKGRNHMKWSPGHMYYKYMPKIAIGTVTIVDEVVECCPKGVFEKKGGKVSIVKNKLFDCHLCGACEKVSGGTVKLEPSGTDFIVCAESWGQLSVKDALLETCAIMDEKLTEFAKLLKK